MQASGKWELYKPLSESTHLDKIIEAIKDDKHGSVVFLDKSNEGIFMKNNSNKTRNNKYSKTELI